MVTLVDSRVTELAGHDDDTLIRTMTILSSISFSSVRSSSYPRRFKVHVGDGPISLSLSYQTGVLGYLKFYGVLVLVRYKYRVLVQVQVQGTRSLL